MHNKHKFSKIYGLQKYLKVVKEAWIKLSRCKRLDTILVAEKIKLYTFCFDGKLILITLLQLVNWYHFVLIGTIFFSSSINSLCIRMH